MGHPPTHPSGEQTTVTQPNTALIYVPGFKNTPLRDVADRLAAASNIRDPERAPRYRSEHLPPVSYGADRPEDNYSADRARVFRSHGEERPVADIFYFSYRSTLTRRWVELNTVWQWVILLITFVLSAFITLWVIVVSLVPDMRGLRSGEADPSVDSETSGDKARWRPVVGWSGGLILGGQRFYKRRAGVSPTDIIQLMWLAGVLAIMGAYLVVLSIAAYWTVADYLMGDGMQFRAEQGLAVLLTSIGVALPKTLKQRFLDAAVMLTTVIQYFLFGSRRKALRGQFNELAERIAESGYERIHIIGYSLGSMIALDTLFPLGIREDPMYRPAAALSLVDTLVLIGSPVDMVRTYRPTYFRDRTGTLNVPKHFINIHTPLDVLSSNFRNDKDAVIKVPSRGDRDESEEVMLTAADFSILENNTGCPRSSEHWDVPVNKVYPLAPSTRRFSARNLIDWIALRGLLSHSWYWGASPSDTDVFSIVVQCLPGWPAANLPIDSDRPERVPAPA